MSRIHGPLHVEVMGPRDAPPMLFLHPNPMDGACWFFQMVHFSSWFRCLAVDLPGYGRSPAASDDVSMTDIAQACWDVVDRAGNGSPAVLVGCSVGSYLIRHMYHLRPSQTDVLVMSGAGWRATKHYAYARMDAYREHGVAFRATHAAQGLAPGFTRTSAGAWLIQLLTERNQWADADTIIAMFDALAQPDPDRLHEDLKAPVLVVSGTLDGAHQSAYDMRDMLEECELVPLEGAGHTCHFERPWEFDNHVLRFLRAHGHGDLPAPDPAALVTG